MNLPVRLVIDRAGCVGQDGETHQGFYDIAFMAALPHMRILSARDAAELVKMLAYVSRDNDGPVAVRFPKKEFEPFDLKAAIKAARLKGYNPFAAEKLAAGTQVLILSEGVFAEKALAAREILKRQKVSAEVLDVKSVHPLPMAQILRALKGKKLLATVENHGTTGGLADLVSRQLREHRVNIRHEAFAFPDEVVPHGTIADIEKSYGLTAEAIAARIARSLRASRR